jgi:hypothetical protein
VASGCSRFGLPGCFNRRDDITEAGSLTGSCSTCRKGHVKDRNWYRSEGLSDTHLTPNNNHFVGIREETDFIRMSAATIKHAHFFPPWD